MSLRNPASVKDGDANRERLRLTYRFRGNRRALVQLASLIHAGNADLVIVAGDVSHRVEHIALTLRALKVAVPTVVYLPGNHDLWAVDGDDDSWTRYRETLPEVVASEGAVYLPSAPLIIDTLALIGTTGWYDYSLLRPEHASAISMDAMRAKQWQGLRWSDDRFARFTDEQGQPMADEQVARQMERELSQHLDMVDRDPGVRDVVVATHFVPFRESLGPPKGMPWDYFDAFMGSVSLGDTILRSSKVRYAVFGHTHRPNDSVVEGITVRGTPLGYPRERKNLPADKLYDHAVGWFDIHVSDA